MKTLTMEELEEVAGGALTCGDKVEIGFTIGGAILGGIGGALGGLTVAGFAEHVIC